MIPYANQLWHWFGRGQFALLILNAIESTRDPDAPYDLTPSALGDQWMKVRWG